LTSGRCGNTLAGVRTGIFLIVVSVVLPGCGDTQPQLSRLSRDAIILAFGDSLTKGTGAGETSSYPAVLAGLTGRTVINAGIPGELSAAGLRRLPRVLDTTSPQLMILCHGGNDLLRKRNPGQLAANIREMISLARQRGVDVVLIGVPRPGLLLGTANLYRDIAASMSVPLEADALADILGDAGLKSDPIHPNAAGYRVMAEALHEILRAAAAL
jgi:lysophospholipase L1-like esterase